MLYNVFSQKNYNDVESFFSNSTSKILLISGKRGVGKTALINYVLDKNNVQASQIIRYRFRPSFGMGDIDDFPAFFEKEYLKRRPLFFLEDYLKKNGLESNGLTLSLSTPLSIIPRLGFRFKVIKISDTESNEKLLDSIIGFLGAKISYIYFEDIENISNVKSLKLIKSIVNSICGNDKIKCILETSAEEPVRMIRNRFTSSSENHLQSISVEALNEENTKDYFKICYNIDAPNDLWDRTKGIPVLIENYYNTESYARNEECVIKKLKDISESAEIILYCMAAIGSNIESGFLKEISFLTNQFEQSLLELYRKKLINFSGTKVDFAHPVFLSYLTAYKSNVKIFGRNHIIEYLRGKSDKTHNEYMDLFRQYELLEEPQKSAYQAMLYAFECYQNQEFNYVLDCAKYVNNLPSDSHKYKMNILLLQSAIRKGCVEEASQFISIIKNDKTYESIMLNAQYLYLQNKFKDAIDKLEDVSAKVEEWYLARILGIKTACYIALGEKQKAIDCYSAATQMNIVKKDSELMLEFNRLLPEISSIESHIQNIFHSLENESAQYAYVIAKISHNYAVHSIFAEVKNQYNKYDYVDILRKSAMFFEKGKYVEYSYSGICVAAFFIKNNQYDNAKAVLESCKDYLHEQYDKFCWHLNQGVIAFYEHKYNDAKKSFLEAKEILNDSSNPLHDPYFCFLLEYNDICLSVALNNNINEIKYRYKNLAIPNNCFHYTKKTNRKDAYLNELNTADIHILEEISEKNNLQVLEVGTLEFFDFNVNVLPQDYITI